MATTLRKLRIVSAFAVGSLFVGSAAGQCQLAKLVAPDSQPNLAFGISPAIDGDRAVFGASWVSYGLPVPGQAYAYTRNASGSWEFVQKLQSPLANPYDAFGYSVGIQGDVLVVGARHEVVMSKKTGAAHAFHWDGSAWSYSSKLEPPDGTADDDFGQSIAIRLPYLVVGAWHAIGASGHSGAAYVFSWDGIAWSFESKLVASDGTNGDEFGCAVAVDGDRLIVGAWNDEQPGLFDSGAAYVFERGTSGDWSESTKLLPSDPYSLDSFGISVALKGDEAYVGAMKGGPSDPGAVYAFHRQPSGSWVQTQKLVPSDPDKGSGFGRSLAIEDDTLLIGAYQGNGAVVNSGTVFVFRRGPSGSWQELAVLEPQNIASYSELGRNISFSGNVAACGVYKDQPNGTLSGSAYLFAVGPDNNGNGVMDPCECPGDINKDWIVDQQDLGILLSVYGTCEGDPGYDPKANLAPGPSPLCPPGVEGIDQADLGVLLANYGNVCP